MFDDTNDDNSDGTMSTDMNVSGSDPIPFTAGEDVFGSNNNDGFNQNETPQVIIHLEDSKEGAGLFIPNDLNGQSEANGTNGSNGANGTNGTNGLIDSLDTQAHSIITGMFSNESMEFWLTHELTENARDANASKLDLAEMKAELPENLHSDNISKTQREDPREKVDYKEAPYSAMSSMLVLIPEFSFFLPPLMLNELFGRDNEGSDYKVKAHTSEDNTLITLYKNNTEDTGAEKHLPQALKVAPPQSSGFVSDVQIFFNSSEDFNQLIQSLTRSGALISNVDLFQAIQSAEANITIVENGETTTTPFSSGIVVLPTPPTPNAAPEGSDRNVAIMEDSPYTLTLSDFGFSDPNNTPSDAFLSVTINSVPSNGSLLLNNAPVAAGQNISVNEISAGHLKYSTPNNVWGMGYAYITFQVQDDGGTNLGGQDMDSTPNTLTLDVYSVNDAPSGADKTITVAEDGFYVFNLSDFGFSDPNDSPANFPSRITITTIPTAGTLNFEGDTVAAGDSISVVDIFVGNLSFKPAANANGLGAASFTFQVKDSGGTANGGVDLDPTPNTITFNITSVNDAPVANSDTLSAVAEDSGQRIILFSDLLGNDSTGPTNESGQSLTIISVGNAVGGTVTLDAANSRVLFTPAANFNGTASFDYTIQDNGTTNGVNDFKTSTASASFTVTEVNDAPQANNDSLSSVAEDSGQRIILFSDLLGNDSTGPTNESGQSLTIISVANAIGGTATLDAANSRILFTPAANFNGTASFDYTIQDNGTTDGSNDFKTSTGSASFTITEVNDAPVANPDSLSSVAEDSLQRSIPFGDLLNNDTTGPGNEFGESLTIISVGNAVGGTVTLDAANSRVLFTPAANFNGTASFDYTIQDNGTTNGVNDFKTSTGSASFTVTEVNDAPVANADTLTSVAEDSGQRIILFSDLLGNDSTGPTNESGQSLTIISVANAIGGTATLDAANSRILFTPAANFNGTASFDYTIQDNGTTDGVNDFKTSTASASFTVTEVNDAPVASADTLSSVAEDSGQRIILFSDLLGNDSTGPTNESGQSLTIISVANAIGGTATLDAANSRILFTPAANFNGTASFDYTIQDNGTTDGVNDFKTSTASASFTVTEVNDAPQANNDSLSSVAEDSGQRIILFSDLLGNDSTGPTNESGQSLTIISVANAIGGTATLDAANSRILFTPAANFNGTASFDYTIQDNGTTNGVNDFKTSTASASFTVTSVNDAPSGTDKTITITEDGTYTFTTADFGFTDPNDNPANALASVTITTTPAAGVVTYMGASVPPGFFVSVADIDAGLLKFVPVANENGAGYATFTFQVQDDGGTAGGGVDLDPSAKTITVNVTEVNDAPTINPDPSFLTIAEDSGQHIIPFSDLLGNDTAGPNESGQTLTITNVFNVSSGTATLDAPNSRILFTPAANFTGTVTFSYTIQDNGTTNGSNDFKTATASASIVVTEVNDAPVANPDTLTSVAEDSGERIIPFSDLLGNDSKGAANENGQSLTIIGVNNAVGGTVELDATNSLIKFTPDANFNGTASFNYTIQDNGTTNGVNDFKTSTASASFTVTSVNDAPEGADKTLTINEDSPYTFSTSDFGFTDPNDSPANSLLAVKITTLPAAGSLTLSGGAVSAGQSITVAQIPNLVFTPAANANGLGYANFTFQVQDNGGTANGGVNLDPSANTITFDVTSVSDAPQGTDNTVTTNEDTTYTFTISDFGYSDPNDSPADSLVAVKITTLPAAGTLRLSGVDVSAGDPISATDISSGNLTFVPVANAHGTGYANFTFQVQDNGSTANGGLILDQTPNTLTINVTSVNDGAPKLFNVGVPPSVMGIDVNAPAPSGAVGSPITSIVHLRGSGADNVTDVDQDIPGIAIISADSSNGTWYYSMDNGNNWSALGAVSGSNARLLAGDDTRVYFQPNAGFNGVINAGFTFRAWDQSSGTNGGVANITATGGTTAFSTASNNMKVVVNVAPTLADANVNLTSINEDPGAPSGAVGTLVSSLVDLQGGGGLNNVTDPDPPAVTGIAITGVSANGSWYATIDGGSNWFLIGSVSDNSARLLAADSNTRLYFLPDANYNGNASFTFRAWDQTTGVNGNTADTTVNGDRTAFSTATDTANIVINSVDDAPSGTSNTFTINEDIPYTFSAASFGFTDPNSSPADTFAAVTITTLPTAGSLTLSGGAVSAGQSIPVAQIPNLVFTPAANANGVGYTSFTFQVQDNGTAMGDSNLDQSPNTITFDVTSINDEPSGTDNTLTINEDVPYTFSAANFGFTDPSDSPANAFTAVTITSLPTAGSLTLSGGAVTAGQSIAVAQIPNLVFTPAVNAAGSGYASFTFQVQDNGGMANGGVDLDQTPNTITFNVTAGPASLFTAGSDTVDFNSASAAYANYTGGTQYNASFGNDIVTMPHTIAAANAAGYDPAYPSFFLGLDGDDTIYASRFLGLSLDGGSGVDILDYSLITGGGVNATLAGGAITTVTGLSGSSKFGATDTIASFEVFFGSDFADTIVGSSSADTIEGGGGNDVIDGGSGNDVYSFKLDSNLGTDTITDTSGIDYISFRRTTDDPLKGVNINLSLTSLQTVATNLSLLISVANSIENVFGDAGNDTIIGGSGNNSLFGFEGADTLGGGAGTNSLVGSIGDDTYVINLNLGSGTTDNIREFSSEGTDLLDFNSSTISNQLFDLNASSTTFTGGYTLNIVTPNDIESVRGTQNTDTLSGNASNNTLIGAGGSDTILANNVGITSDGNDVFYGDAVGSAGASPGDDVYLYDLDGAVNLGTDTIFEYGSGGSDTLSFANTTAAGNLFVSLSNSSTQAVSSVLSLIMDVTTGDNIETLIGVASGGSNTLIGNAGSNVIQGGSLGDTLQGLGGSDTLIGGAGTNTLVGGAGDDVYRINVASGTVDTITEVSGEGIDTLDFSLTSSGSFFYDLNAASSNLGGYLLNLNTPTQIENVIGTANTDTFGGNSVNNTFVGGGGADTFLANSASITTDGNDVFYGDAVGSAGVSPGNDLYLYDLDGAVNLGTDSIFEYGSGGADTISFANTTGAGINLALSLSNSATQAVSSSLSLILDATTGANIESVIGVTGGTNTLTGGSGDNTLIGGDLNDTIEGLGGNDLLMGAPVNGLGNDVYKYDLDFNTGTDTIDDPFFNNTIDFSATTTQSVTFNANTFGVQSIGNGSSISLMGTVINTITGGTQADILIGHGNGSTFEGLGGNDTLTGSATAGDRYIYDLDIATGADILSSDGSAGNVIDFSSTTTVGAFFNAGTTTIQDLTNAISQSIIGPAKITIGTTLFSTIIGGQGSDTFTGTAANETFIGGGGNDSIVGGNGNDYYIFNTADGGNKALPDSGGTSDTLDLSSSPANNITYTISVAGLTTGGMTFSGLGGFENFFSAGGDDTITGSTAVNIISGGGGVDSLNGGGNADTLAGGAGADRLTGGTGIDVYRYDLATDVGDTITNYESGEDFLFENAVFAGDTSAPLGTPTTPQGLDSPGTQFTTNVAAPGNAIFIFDTTNKVLFYDADGSGSGVGVIVATLQAGAPNITSGDIMFF